MAWGELEQIVEEASGPEGLVEVLASMDGEVLKALRSDCWRARLRSFGRQLLAFRPWPKFPSISITGRRCELMCKYCMGAYLKGMLHAERPEELLELCSRLADKGANGVLISGGYTRDGVLPVRPFLKAIRAVKERFGLTVAIHPGLVGRELAEEIASAGVDVALCEVLGDEGTIREAVGLDKKPEDYLASMLALRDAGVPKLAPHVPIGMWGGVLAGELEALKMVRAARPDVLVLIVFMPTRGTPYATRKPPGLADVEKLMAVARLMFPSTPVALGCMRPRERSYRARLDVAAVELGLDRIVLPAGEAVEKAGGLGLEVAWRDTCCAIP